VADFLVNRKDIRETRVADAEPPEPAEGQALLEVDRFGLTANNITYAVFGEAMSYWYFFPGPEGWGRVPVWGFADVAESRAEGLEAGTRVYGYLPPSSHLLVTPAADPRGFRDQTEHRRALPAAYQRYDRADADPFYREGEEDVQMLLRPLFSTSFLIDDMLADEGLAGGRTVVIGSASSKTALAAAFLLAAREDVELVGLTSSRSRDFVEGLGVYGATVTYDEIESLGPGPATFVDMSGDGDVRLAVHSHFGDELTYSMSVGMTHWEEMAAGAGEDLPGPAPKFFFAPDRAKKRAEDWGAAGLGERVVERWREFADWAAGWLGVERRDGFDGLGSAYREVLDGDVGPDRAHVVSLRGQAPPG
jgi:hypothetical protein